MKTFRWGRYEGASRHLWSLYKEGKTTLEIAKIMNLRQIQIEGQLYILKKNLEPESIRKRMQRTKTS